MQGKKGTGEIMEPSPFARRAIGRRRVAVDMEVTLAARLHAVSRTTRLPIVAILEKALEAVLPQLEHDAQK